MTLKKGRTYDLINMITPSIFEGLSSGVVNDLKTLPVTHKNSFDRAKEILSDGMITPKQCTVFSKERLVYLFYGRASYRVSDKILKKDPMYYPICFVLNANSIDISNVFPFDSGAFAYELYKKFIDVNIDINEYYIEPQIISIKRLVSHFYGDNKKYYNVEPNFVISSDDEGQDKLLPYMEMLNESAKTNEYFDKRGSTIEILTKTNVELCSSLIAIIVPIDLEGEVAESIDKLQTKFNVDIIPYLTPGGSPDEYNIVVCNELLKYYMENNYI